MIGGWLKFLKRQRAKPEDSAPFRFWVGVNVTLALVATAAQMDWPAYLAGCLALTWFGMALSHRLRGRNNWEVKVGLSIFMVVALVNFFVGLAASYFDPREPLAELLMWLQALHSCDLPSRKDLSYSLLSALILMSVAAVLSVSGSFAWFLLAYFVTATVALRWNYRSLVGERTGWLPPDVRQPGSWKLGIRLGVSVALAGGLVILCMPRLQAFRIRAMPVSWQMRLQLKAVSQGEVKNPFYPEMSKEQMRRNRNFNPEGYSGFNTVVDLQTRGHLAHERVFQVRTNAPTYFRGLAFDSYDGQFWTVGETQLKTLNIEAPPFQFSPLSVNPEDVVQIFYIDRPLANLVLFAPQAYQVFFPSQQLFQDRNGCLRAPFTLEQDMVYSVVSRVSHLPERRLLRLPHRDPELRRLRPYLELPAAFPARVGELARRLTKDDLSDYGKVTRLALHLRNNFKYNLDVPPYPEGVDVADHLLFSMKEGYCEQFATALTTMCRSLGIPARYCTGYLPGRYNPFTGFFEVFGDNAHAWTEAYLAGYGWMTFDGTPEGTLAPDVQPETPPQRWLGAAILQYVSEQLQLNWGKVAPWLYALASLLLALGARKALRGRGPGGADPVSWSLEQALALPRFRSAPGSTPRQVAARFPEVPQLQQLVSLHEAAIYSGQGSAPEVRGRARRLLAELRRLKKTT